MSKFNPFDDIDPIETSEWLESIDSVLTHARPRAGTLPAEPDDRLRAPVRRVPAVLAEHGLPEYDCDRTAAGVPGRSLDRATYRGLHPLECDGDGRAGESRQYRVRRPHLQLRLVGDAVRSRFQSLLARRRSRDMPATWCSCRDTRRRASTRAHSSRADSTEEQLEAFSPARSAAAGCRRTRIRG